MKKSMHYRSFSFSPLYSHQVCHYWSTNCKMCYELNTKCLEKVY